MLDSKCPTLMAFSTSEQAIYVYVLLGKQPSTSGCKGMATCQALLKVAGNQIELPMGQCTLANAQRTEHTGTCPPHLH
jgi:hypothetical protein